MKVIITGGGGFLGQALARELAKRGELANKEGIQETISDLVLLDVCSPPEPIEGSRYVQADLSSPGTSQFRLLCEHSTTPTAHPLCKFMKYWLRNRKSLFPV